MNIRALSLQALIAKGIAASPAVCAKFKYFCVLFRFLQYLKKLFGNSFDFSAIDVGTENFPICKLTDLISKL